MQKIGMHQINFKTLAPELYEINENKELELKLKTTQHNKKKTLYSNRRQGAQGKLNIEKTYSK